MGLCHSTRVHTHAHFNSQIYKKIQYNAFFGLKEIKIIKNNCYSAGRPRTDFIVSCQFVLSHGWEIKKALDIGMPALYLVVCNLFYWPM